MKYTIIECDGCGKNLGKTDGENPLVFHNLQLDYNGYFRDPNTEMHEEITNLARKTHSVLCNDCFIIYTKHMDNFLNEVSPGHDKMKFPPEIDESIEKAQSNEEDNRLNNVAVPRQQSGPGVMD